jgi:hypothetical protein
MMRPHRTAPTTRTLELSQLVKINERLARTKAEPITAATLMVSGTPAGSEAGEVALPATAVLRRVSWDGPPEYPYIHGIFTVRLNGAPLTVELHTALLRDLSRRIGLRQQWGVDPQRGRFRSLFR